MSVELQQKGSFQHVSPYDTTLEVGSKTQEFDFSSKWWDRTRFMIIRNLACPLPIPRSVPLIGGKSFLELAMAGGVLAAIFISGTSGDPGSVASTLGLVVVALAMRNNIILSMLGMSFEHALFWHKFLGVVIWALIIMHGLERTLEGEGGDRRHRKLEDDEGLSTTGLVLACAVFMMGAVYLLSWFKLFNTFYFLHIALYVVIVAFAFLHGADVFGYSIIIWGADLLIRYGLRHKSMEGTITVQSSELVKISIPNNDGRFKHASGQYCFLRVRALNHYEYHPFSISSGIGEENLTFHIKRCGDWTEKLAQLVGEKGVDGVEEGAGKSFQTVVDIEGPYGGLSADLFNPEVYQTVVLVSGGVGITPCLSVWKDLLRSSKKPQKVIMLWSVRDVETFTKLYDDQFKRVINEEKELASSHSENPYALNDLTAFEYFFYVTKGSGSYKGSSGACQFGRPNMNQFFQEVCNHSNRKADGGRIGVIVSGPFSLVNEVQNVCTSFRGQAKIDVHEEYFSF